MRKSESRLPRWLLWLSGIATLSLLFLLGYLLLRSDAEEETVGSQEEFSETGVSERESETETPRDDSGGDVSVNPGDSGLPVTAFDLYVGRLEHSVSGQSSQIILQDLLSWLKSLEPAAAAELLTWYLESGKNVVTYGKFKLSKEGFLSDYPSLRVALLDFLEQVDPESALAYSRQLLEYSVDPEEWAVALRSLAGLSDEASDLKLAQQKALSLVANPAWREEASPGYLQAYDVLVYLKSSEAIGLWCEQIDSSVERRVGHASIVALDRLIQAAPEASLDTLMQQSALLESQRGLRASLFARAEPSDPQQVELLENYLGSEQFSDEEKLVFLELFPNQNSTYSYNLLTQFEQESREVMIQRLADAATVLENWVNSGRYPNLESSLSENLERLQSWQKPNN